MLQNNAHVNTAHVLTDEADNCDFELLFYVTYSPSLASPDFYLFVKLKSHIREHHFGNNDEVIHAV